MGGGGKGDGQIANYTSSHSSLSPSSPVSIFGQFVVSQRIHRTEQRPGSGLTDGATAAASGISRAGAAGD